MNKRMRGRTRAADHHKTHLGAMLLFMFTLAALIAAFLLRPAPFFQQRSAGPVVSVGRLEPEKGALQFAQAAPLLGDDFVLALAGEGSQRTQIEGLGANNVLLLGQLGQPELSALLRDADVFCLPTRSEGFCTSLLEAAAQGAIPVMPHVGGTDEVMGWNPVHHGVMLKDNEPEAVAQAIREAAEQDGIAVQELREHVAMNCSWDATVKALEDAFAALD